MNTVLESDWGLEVAVHGQWYAHKVTLMPAALRPTTIVDVKLRNGQTVRRPAHEVFWNIDGQSHGGEVLQWRVIPEDEVPPARRPGDDTTLHFNMGVKQPSLFNVFEQWGKPAAKPHAHYFKDVKHLETIDVYRVLSLFNVTDPCLQHAVKKLLVAGGRGAGKDITRDVQEAIDSLTRWQAMRAEDGGL